MGKCQGKFGVGAGKWWNRERWTELETWDASLTFEISDTQVIPTACYRKEGSR